MGNLVDTWGGSTSNAYTTLTDANKFIRSAVVDITAWTAADERKQEAALIQATIDIDSKQYIGSRYYSDQKLEFPRAVTGDTYHAQVYASLADMTTVQQRMQSDVQRACCYQALWILQNAGRNQHAERIASGIAEATRQVGPIQETYKYRAGNEQPTLSPMAVKLLATWTTTRKIVRS